MTISLKTFTPHPDKVFVTDLESGFRESKGGIIIMDDNGKDHGIRSRWGKVWAVGKNVDELQVGEWVLIEHGRWTYGMDLEFPDGTVKVWQIDYPEHVLVATDEFPGAKIIKL